LGSNPKKEGVMSTPIIDRMHVSGHFKDGKYDHPLVQKVHEGGRSIKIFQDVDREGNLGETGFDTRK
jgi:hypothetical protein